MIDTKYYSDKIINNFKSEFINCDGFISRDYPPSKRTIFDNFDDIAPFFIYFDELPFLQDQINKLNTDNFDYLFFDNLIYSFKIDEFLGGLYSVYKVNKNSKTKKIINNFLKFLEDKFLIDNHFFGVYDKRKNETYRIEYPWSSGILETFIEMKDDFPYLKDYSTKIVDRWIESEYFKKFKLFPYNFSDHNFFQKTLKIKQQQFPFSKKNNLKSSFKIFYNQNIQSPKYSRIMKQNSTLIFTIIELYRINNSLRYKEVVSNWINSVNDKLIHDNILYGEWFPNNNYFDDNITHTFIFIDIICDYLTFIEYNKEYEEVGKRLIDKRLNRLTKNYLVSENYKGFITHIDSCMDFAISIRRFGEITNSNEYLDISNKILHSILKLHKYKFAYATFYEDGKGILEIKKNTIDPKYNGLLLKGIISLECQNKKIHESKYIHDLFKDR